MNGMSEKDLKLWIGSLLKKEGRNITEATANFLLEQVGTDMGKLQCEVEKLICYTLGRNSITIEDIKAICSQQITGKIFAMTEAMAQGKKEQALELYYDLISVQERPLGILYMIQRQFHFLLIVKEMVDLLCLDLVDKGLVTDSISLQIGFENRLELPMARGTETLPITTSSAKTMMPYVEALYERIIPKTMGIRRVNLTFNNVIDEAYQQYDLFIDPAELERERKIQRAMIDIKKKFGKNAILKGMNLEEGATTMERNQQTGGHRAGSSEVEQTVYVNGPNGVKIAKD